MRRRHVEAVFSFLLVLAVLPVRLCGQADEPQVRVALVSTCPGDVGAGALALAEVALSKTDGVILVERREVERILREQELAQAGLSCARQATVVGKLLGVEVFAALENLPGEPAALGLVVFDAATGVRLCDTLVGHASADKQADSISAAVQRACTKRRQRAATHRTICVAAVRNADLPRAWDSAVESLGWLLQQRLTESADVTVLERERLEEINRERALPNSALPSDLASALTLLEIEVGTSAGAHAIKASVFLSDARGNALGNLFVIGTSTNILGVAEQLLAALTSKLAVAQPDRKWDHAAEASRFHREAKFLINHDYIKRGLEAAEAAYALEPTNKKYQQGLALVLVHCAHNLLQPGLGAHLNSYFRPLKVPSSNLSRSLELALRALEIHTPAMWDYIRRVGFVTDGHNSETRRLMSELERRSCNQIVNQARNEFARSPFDFTRCTSSIDYRLSHLEHVATTPAVWSFHMLEMVSAWLELAKTNHLAWDASLAANHLLVCSGIQFVGRVGLGKAQVTPSLSKQDVALWQNLFATMVQHPVPLVQLYGRINQLRLELRISPRSANVAAEKSRAIVKLVEEQIADPRLGVQDRLQLLYYRAALDAIDVLPPDILNHESRWSNYSALLDFMLNRREIVASVVSVATKDSVHWRHAYPRHLGGGPSRNPETLPAQYGPVVLRNIERVLSLLNASDVRLLDCDRDGLKSELVELQRNLQKRAASSGLPASHPWKEARLIFEVGNGVERIGEIVVNGNTLYLIGLGAGFIQPVKLDIRGGRATALSKARHSWRNTGNPGSVITSACASDGNIFVGTLQDGIFVFPEDGGEPQHLSTAQALPSSWVRSVSYLDGKVYAGLGKDEGFLVSFDLQARLCTTLVSSRRKEKRSPLDDASPPFVTRHLRSDAAKHRIIAEISQPRISQPFVRDDRVLSFARGEKQLTGLWQINTQTGELQQLLELRSGIDWASPVRNGQLLLFQPHPWSIISFDLQTDKARLLFHSGPFPLLQTVAPADETAKVAPEWKPPLVMLDGWLWADEPFGRLSRDGMTAENFPPLPNSKPRYGFDTVGIEAVDNGRAVLVVFKTQVWLLVLSGN